MIGEVAVSYCSAFNRALLTTRIVINSLVASVKALLHPCPKRGPATSMEPDIFPVECCGCEGG